MTGAWLRTFSPLSLVKLTLAQNYSKNLKHMVHAPKQTLIKVIKHLTAWGNMVIFPIWTPYFEVLSLYLFVQIECVIRWRIRYLGHLFPVLFMTCRNACVDAQRHVCSASGLRLLSVSRNKTASNTGGKSQILGKCRFVQSDNRTCEHLFSSFLTSVHD